MTKGKEGDLSYKSEEEENWLIIQRLHNRSDVVVNEAKPLAPPQWRHQPYDFWY